MLFRPNTTCQVRATTGERDVFSRPVFTDPVTVQCAVVSYDLVVKKSSVRADSSGSRGRADEKQGLARFLFPKTASVKTGDLVTKDNFTLRVVEVQPRYSVAGRLDHLEVDMEKAEEENAASS